MFRLCRWNGIIEEERMRVTDSIFDVFFKLVI